MREQHSILYLIGKNGKIIDFQRFSVKTTRGIFSMYRKAIRDNVFLIDYMLDTYRKAETIEIWSTETNGEEIEKIYDKPAEEFLTDIECLKEGKKTA